MYSAGDDESVEGGIYRGVVGSSCEELVYEAKLSAVGSGPVI